MCFSQCSTLTKYFIIIMKYLYKLNNMNMCYMKWLQAAWNLACKNWQMNVNFEKWQTHAVTAVAIQWNETHWIWTWILVWFAYWDDKVMLWQTPYRFFSVRILLFCRLYQGICWQCVVHENHVVFCQMLTYIHFAMHNLCSLKQM